MMPCMSKPVSIDWCSNLRVKTDWRKLSRDQNTGSGRLDNDLLRERIVCRIFNRGSDASVTKIAHCKMELIVSAENEKRKIAAWYIIAYE